MNRLEADGIARDLRVTIVRAQEELVRVLRASCPGAHRTVSSGDGRSPWCRMCRRYADGTAVAR